jgi:hypothetical protein
MPSPRYRRPEPRVPLAYRLWLVAAVMAVALVVGLLIGEFVLNS